MYKINIDRLFELTNNGLDIILSYYPDARPGKNFKIRPQEKTASASIKQNHLDGRWLVTDFGYDSKPRNAIAIVELEESITYGEALNFIAKKFKIPYENGEVIEVKPVFKKYKKKSPELTGKEFLYKDSFSDFELKTFGKYVTNEVCMNYNVKAIKTILVHKELETIEIHSTDDYPIFTFEREGYKKIYQPLAEDKKHRFTYDGKLPKHEDGSSVEILWGYEHCLKKKKDLNEDRDSKVEPKERQLEYIFIMAGDRDALNMASLGFPVIWKNSESKMLSKVSFNKLQSIAKMVINVPDLDITGVREGVKIALQHVELRTLWLPDYIRERIDFRGNPFKDFRDFIYLNRYLKREQLIYKVKQLIKTAYPMQFWKVYINKNAEKKCNYITEYALNFITRNQFYRYKQPDTKEGYIYIHIKNNIVSKIPVSQTSVIKNYTLDWLRSKHIDIEVLELIHSKGAKYTDANLNSLPFKEIDFRDSAKNYQYFSFLNEIWKITKNDIEVIKPKDAPYYIWEDNIIQNKVKKQPKQFNIIRKDTGGYDIEILNKESHVLNYLINTSRIYWQKEFEHQFPIGKEKERQAYIIANKFNIAGPYLSPIEIDEQKTHLVNKVFSIGYLLHSYKNKSRPWAVFAMDGKLSPEGKSYGGSGKSILYNTLIPYLISSVDLNGRNSDTFKNAFVFENVTEHINYVILDDTHEYFSLDPLFQPLTSNWPVNPKNNKSYSVPFEKSPKIAITSNYPLKKIDGSTMRRILYTVFSDFYHKKTAETDYRDEKEPVSDFNGRNFIDDWNAQEFNTYINFMMQCVQFYLSVSTKVDPPLNNVLKRNFLTDMGEAFKEWADMYFSDKLNRDIHKKDMVEEAQKTIQSKYLTPHSFHKKLKAWCAFYGHDLDPTEMCGSDGKRIIRRDKELGTHQIHFIRTIENIPDDVNIDLFNVKKEEDAPF